MGQQLGCQVGIARLGGLVDAAAKHGRQWPALVLHAVFFAQGQQHGDGCGLRLAAFLAERADQVFKAHALNAVLEQFEHSDAAWCYVHGYSVSTLA